MARAGRARLSLGRGTPGSGSRVARVLLVLALAAGCGGPGPARDRGTPDPGVAGRAGVGPPLPSGTAVPPGRSRFPVAIAESGGDTAAATTPLGRLMRSLSEPGGYFPSDNLVSNETSYLHVVPALKALGVRGGAYIGVGPDQNFSYIAHVRPAIAFIIDIRRDNLLHQLLFKALFEKARNRVEYLGLMLGRPVPAELSAWDGASLDEIVLYMDTVAATVMRFEESDSLLLAAIPEYGYPLSPWDLETIRGIHSAFFELGLGIRYAQDASGRSRRYPTWRQLLLQTDLEGNRGSYLASEESFRYVKRLQRQDRIVPVVGDLGGPHALAAIGREIAARGLTVSAFYVSNVEQYLMRGPGFGTWAETVAGLPVDERSVIIRSYFARRYPIPQSVPGHLSTQLLERIEAFIETAESGGYLSYLDLVTRNAIPLGGRRAGAGAG